MSANPNEVTDLKLDPVPAPDLVGRRRLVRAGLTAAPVILALGGQSALAATGCASPSAVVSGNLSPGRQRAPCGAGLSPGYWKVSQHLAEWSVAGISPGTFSNGTSGTGMQMGSQLATGTLFKQIGPFANSGSLGNYSAWRILAYPSQVDAALAAFSITQVQLARHLIATYLNSFKVGATFPLTTAAMKVLWEDGSLGTYCPNAGCTQPWSTQQVVCYLRNYTMDQTSLSSDPISWVC